jgi:hypothetical protein
MLDWNMKTMDSKALFSATFVKTACTLQASARASLVLTLVDFTISAQNATMLVYAFMIITSLIAGIVVSIIFAAWLATSVASAATE